MIHMTRQQGGLVQGRANRERCEWEGHHVCTREGCDRAVMWCEVSKVVVAVWSGSGCDGVEEGGARGQIK